MDALKNKEGCEIEGEVQIHKVPGNFHISSHDQGNLMNRIYQKGQRVDFTHTINTLSFGNKEEERIVRTRFGETIKNELEGKTVTEKDEI